MQVPPPSQSNPETPAAEQVVAPQDVVDFANPRHAPAPSQRPSARHEVGKPGSMAHALFGSVSAATGAQTPSAPLPFFVLLHASQGSVHVLSQQTESTQKPLLHCPLRAQVAPGSRSAVHVVPEQNAVVAQLVSEVQLVPHAGPEQA